jgi:hypothetical protein
LIEGLKHQTSNVKKAPNFEFPRNQSAHGKDAEEGRQSFDRKIRDGKMRGTQRGGTSEGIFFENVGSCCCE